MSTPARTTPLGAAPLCSIVVPVFNEEANLPELIDRTLAVGNAIDGRFELILVDDGSSDRSREIITRSVHDNGGRVVGVFLNRNYGQHPAVLAGMTESTGDVIVTLDADLQNFPEDIPSLLQGIKSGCDVVAGIRQQRRDSQFRRWASATVNAVARYATGVEMRDYGCMLRAYRRPVVEAILQCDERSTFIPILANSFASKTTEVAVRHEERSGDESKYTLWRLINLQFDMLTSMTTFPLRLLSLAGTVLALSGIASGVGLLVMRFIYGAAWAGDGVFTILAVLFFLIGVQLLGMGLMGEYIGRIYADVRRRPKFFVGERVVAEESPDPNADTADKSGDQAPNIAR